MDVRILAAGDSAWSIELPEQIDEAVNRRAIEIASALQNTDLPITDVVVGYRSVMVYVDPLDARASAVERRLRDVVVATQEGDAVTGPLGEVPVCYDELFGPDLGDVAAFGGCHVDEVIARHLAVEYRVFVVG